MAVATPVLERVSDTEETRVLNYNPTTEEDELHNSRISRNYQKLINPEATISDLLHPEVNDTYVPAEIKPQAPAAEPVEDKKEEIYRVESARTDSYLFRADSFLYQKEATAQEEAIKEVAAQEEADEEENEDLRPTATTIQYKTTGTKKTEEEGTFENKHAAKHVSFSKRDKIIIAVVVSVIVALFVLIVVNSAIITGLNNDLGSLQSSLNQARNVYQRVANEVTDYNSNLENTVNALAESLGMSK